MGSCMRSVYFMTWVHLQLPTLHISRRAKGVISFKIIASNTVDTAYNWEMYIFLWTCSRERLTEEISHMKIETFIVEGCMWNESKKDVDMGARGS
jgi:hypothetical protein